jgi:selenocysteine-specific elongation factor
MRHALVAVLGHVDHGKTALVRALTGTDTDRLPEEKRRGISILPGYARLAAEGAELDLVDVPGHERFVRAMVAGASAMRAALLVVDAREGVRPQTREHAEIAALLGVVRGVVAVARADLATDAERAAAAEAARALLRELGRGDWPCVECSAVTGEGLEALAEALFALAEPPCEGEAGRAWMPLDRAFHRPGAGLVVTGALRQGALRVGEEVELWPGPRRATVRGLQSHGRAVAGSGPGRRLAVALRGGEAAPGDTLAAPGLLAACAVLDVTLHVLASAPRALRRGEALRFLCGTAEAGARLRLLDRAALEPGEGGVAQLILDDAMALPVRAGFVLRLPSPARTIAGGEVLDAEAPRRRARDAQLLRAMAMRDVAAAARAALRAAGARGLPAARLRRLAGGDWPEDAVELAGGVALDGEILGTLDAALVSAVAKAQHGDPLGGGAEAKALLRTALPAGAPREGIAARLVARRALRLVAGRLSLPEAPTLDDGTRALLQDIEEAWHGAGLSPPETAAVAAGDPRRAAAIRHLVAQGVLLRAPDAVQKREYLFHRDAIAAAIRALTPHLDAEPGGLTVSDCNRILGLTRRHGVPLLERLDTLGFTRREGDRRLRRPS